MDEIKGVETYDQEIKWVNFNKHFKLDQFSLDDLDYEDVMLQ